jgi:hypothetical protein
MASSGTGPAPGAIRLRDVLPEMRRVFADEPEPAAEQVTA